MIRISGPEAGAALAALAGRVATAGRRGGTSITVASSPCFMAREDWPGIAPKVLAGFNQMLAGDFMQTIERFLAIQAMGSDYIRTARAKGLSRASILLKHALRNAAIPVVAIAAVQLGFMLGGSIVIEQVFALHGVGYLAWESIGKNDFPVVQAVVLVLAVIYVALTMLADLMNAVLDPRLRGP